jgi:threonine synthase
LPWLFFATAKWKVTVLVATSGDTGGAVANGFLGVDGVEVIILYPSGKVSDVQELQLTTCGQNITALEVNGSFDDCQAMVKDAFMDADLNQKLQLTSANSINVARWLPQQLYYFFAYQQWKDKDHPPVISVPSGNFGNICAGLLAHVSGLPVQHFIAACNVNDAVPEYLRSGNYQSKTQCLLFPTQWMLAARVILCGYWNCSNIIIKTFQKNFRLYGK